MARVSKILIALALFILKVNKLKIINCHPNHFTDLQPKPDAQLLRNSEKEKAVQNWPSSKVVQGGAEEIFQDLTFPQSDEPRQLISLGSQTRYTHLSPCATVLTTTNCLLQIPDDATHINLRDKRFAFAAGITRDKCVLTVLDCFGSYSNFGISASFLFPPTSVYNTVSSVCCECSGCNRPNLSIGNSCAVLFEHEKCSLCSGFRLEVQMDDTIAHMNSLVDNKVSSIYVAQGCELLVFKEPDFQGQGARAPWSFDGLSNEWNDVISSYKCFCKTDATFTSIQPEITTTVEVFTSIQPEMTTTVKAFTSTTEISSPHTETTTMRSENKEETSTTAQPIIMTTSTTERYTSTTEESSSPQAETTTRNQQGEIFTSTPEGTTSSEAEKRTTELHVETTTVQTVTEYDYENTLY